MAHPRLGLAPSVNLVLASAFWAAGTVIAKQVLTFLPPIAFLILQLAPSVIVLWLMVLASTKPSLARRDLLLITLLGWLNPGLSYTLSMLGLAQTTASVATLLWAAEPALIIAMAWLLLRERLSPGLVGLAALAACGVLLVSNVLGIDTAAVEGGFGYALILGGVLCCAIYTILSRRIITAADPLFIVALQQSVGLAWVVVIWPMEGSSAADILALPLRDIAAGALSGLMYYVVAFWFYLRGLRSVPASTAGMFFNLIPVFGIAAAYVFLDERLTASQWAGAAIILGAVLALLARSPAPVVEAAK
jgi:drug/metabolite transporter (DMT)-like permease